MFDLSDRDFTALKIIRADHTSIVLGRRFVSASSEKLLNAKLIATEKNSNMGYRLTAAGRLTLQNEEDRCREEEEE